MSVNFFDPSLKVQCKVIPSVEENETFPTQIVDKIFSYLPLRDLSKQIILNNKYRVICIDRLKLNERNAFYELVDFFLQNPTMQEYGLDYELNKFRYEIDYSKKNINEIEDYSMELLKKLMKLLEIIPNEGFLNIVPNRNRFNLLIIYRNVESGNWKEAVKGLTLLLNHEKNDELILIIKALRKYRMIRENNFEELIQIIPDDSIENDNYSFYNLLVNIFLKYILKYDVAAFASLIKKIDVDLDSLLTKLSYYIRKDFILDSLNLKLLILEKNQEANELESHFGNRFREGVNPLRVLIIDQNSLLAKKIALNSSRSSRRLSLMFAKKFASKGDIKSMLEIAEILQKNSFMDRLISIQIYHMALIVYVNRGDEASFWLFLSKLNTQIKTQLLRDLGIHLALENKKIAIDLCNEIHLDPDSREQILKIYNYSQNGNIKDNLYDFVSCLDSKHLFNLSDPSEQDCLKLLTDVIFSFYHDYDFNFDNFSERYQMKRNSMGFCFISNS